MFNVKQVFDYKSINVIEVADCISYQIGIDGDTYPGSLP